MSGGLTMALARALPERVAAAASIHGAWLVRDTPDSPHLGLDPVQAEVYFAWVDDDPTRPGRHGAGDARGPRRRRRDATPSTSSPAPLHGFAPAGERYDRHASELHWERVHSLLRRNL